MQSIKYNFYVIGKKDYYVKIQLSLSNAPSVYKKGARVVVNVGTAKRPEYYLATITSVRADKWHILFDDGDKGYVDTVKDIKGLVGKRTRKSGFGKEELHKYLISPSEKNTEVDVDGTFGNLLFGEGLQGFKTKFEKNTSPEARALDALKSFVSGVGLGPSLTPSATKAIKLLIAHKSKFKALLQPTAKFAYRGSPISLKKWDFSLITPKTPVEKFLGIDHYKISVVYKPHTKVQSWTVNPLIAGFFSTGPGFYPERSDNAYKSMIKKRLASQSDWVKRAGGKSPFQPDHVYAVYKTQVDSSFVGSPKLAAALAETVLQQGGGLSEEEIFRLGSSIKCTMYVEKKLYANVLKALDFLGEDKLRANAYNPIRKH